MGKDKERVPEPGKWRQFLAALIANVSALSYGTMVGWQSPMAPQLQGEDPPVGSVPMTEEEASWLSGIMCLSGTLASLGLGLLTERLGRKATGCLMALPLCLCWILTIFASSHAEIFVARFFAGIGGAASLFLVPLYVSEIAGDSVRGMLGSLLVFVLNIGVLLSYIFGAILSFRVFAMCALLLPLVYLVAFLFLPETPVYLVRKNRLREAARSLMWLKAGHEPTVEREILRLQAEMKERAASHRSVKLADLFRDRGTIKGLIISLGLFGGQQLCGIFAMISYTENIFRISGSSLSPNASAITIAAIQVLGSYLSTLLMERTGRRPLILISCLGMCVSHLVLGAFCYVQDLPKDVSGLSWLPIVALSVFMIAYCLGMGPGPYVVVSEIFARDVSGMAITVSLFFVWVMAFVVVKFFPSLVGLLGMHGCFFLLATFCASTFVFALLLLPETKGRPRELIVDELNGIPYALKDRDYITTQGTIEKNGLSPEHV
ncbi:hypothetical protein KM043_003010 [Ampulex compressa]|nr:hypothetical protein KM043_003010 [Ampulex compressa]